MSIITEALKKAERERSRPADPKDYLNKIIGPQVDMSYSPAADTGPADTNTHWWTRRVLMVSGALIVTTIVFLSAMNIFIISSMDKEASQSARIAKSGRGDIEAEAYSTAMYPDISKIERQPSIFDKMTIVLKGGTTKEEFTSNFTLNGIIYDADNSWAIINNTMVKRGDVLNGAEVLSISPQKVAVSFKDGLFDLSVK